MVKSRQRGSWACIFRLGFGEGLCLNSLAWGNHDRKTVRDRCGPVVVHRRLRRRKWDRHRSARFHCARANADIVSGTHSNPHAQPISDADTNANRDPGTNSIAHSVADPSGK